MRFAIAILLSLICFAAAQAAVSTTNNSHIGYVDAVMKTTSGATSYPEEMVLLTVRTVLFRTQVAEEELEQPALVNFSWKQLGPDRSYRTEVDGAPAVVFERILALFPVKAGKLTIGAFVHHITFVGADNVRHEADLRSSPIRLEVRPWASARGGPDATDSWWLPAQSLTITDKWEPEPDRLNPGETAHRTVTLEAAGITADRLPPAPKFHSHGVLTFGGTVERATLSTPTGPLARATYRWDVGLAYGVPATIRAIHIPWFDTIRRRMRDVVIPARRVEFTTQLRSSGITTSKFSRIGWIGSGFVSFVIALAILFAGSVTDGESFIAPIARYVQTRQQLWEMRRSARSGDARAFRSALYRLARRDPERWRESSAASSVGSRLGAIDDYLFGYSGAYAPDIRKLSRDIAAAWRTSKHSSFEVR